jgi:hypothetical protein
MILVAVLASAAGPALAQSENELRQENQALKDQVRELQAELDAARQKLQRMEQTVERLQRELVAGRSAPDARPPMKDLAPEEISIDESVPNASPRALQRALTDSYEEAMKDLEIGQRDDRARRAYLVAVRSWAARISKGSELRDAIRWHVRVLPEPPVHTTRGLGLRLQAIDPVTEVELGGPFEVVLPKPVVNRLERAVRTFDTEHMILRGAIAPRVRVNTQRMEAGPFDRPQLLGPFAEFGFIVDVRSLLPPELDRDEEDKDARNRKDKAPATRPGG